MVALEVSVLARLEEREGWDDAAAFGLPVPKEPLLSRDSAARESDVMVPTPS